MNSMLIVLAVAVVIGVAVVVGLMLRRPRGQSKNYLAEQDYAGLARVILDSIGGANNLSKFDHCVSRLRLEVKNPDLINEKPIRSAGIAGLMRPEKTKLQLIIGTRVTAVSDALKSLVD